MSDKQAKTPNPAASTSGNLPDTPNKGVPPPPPPRGSGDRDSEDTRAAAGADRELIDPEKDKALLQGIQGNILKGHGRDHVKLVFLRFKDKDVKQVKAALAEFYKVGYVQTAAQQLHFVERFNRFGIPGPLFANVLLSPTGLQHLDLKPGEIQEASQDKPSVPVKFSDGAKALSTVHALDDPPVDAWEPAYQEQIDCLIILADDDYTNLINGLENTINIFEPVAHIVTIESGNALRNRFEESIEHFGYVDGRSQPLFFTSDLEKEIVELDGEQPDLPGSSHYVKWDPRAHHSLVLIPDPFVAEAPENLGSFFVFRKLEQNVRGFKQQEQVVADKLGLTGEAREIVGAYMVGRFEDGTPVTMRDDEGLHSPVPNNFNYADDVEGRKCPFGAHIRKVNPRGDHVRVRAPEGDTAAAAQLEEEERSHRIARRGITYGENKVDSSDPDNLNRLPTRDLGLLFMCFQASIPRQFAFMQKVWANGERSIKPGTGIDPLIGQSNPRSLAANPTYPILPSRPMEHRIPLEWDEPGTIRCSFNGFVTMRGGEFFFAPSIAWLKSLALPTPGTPGVDAP